MMHETLIEDEAGNVWRLGRYTLPEDDADAAPDATRLTPVGMLNGQPVFSGEDFPGIEEIALRLHIQADERDE
jgi:hypothetical protein